MACSKATSGTGMSWTVISAISVEKTTTKTHGIYGRIAQDSKTIGKQPRIVSDQVSPDSHIDHEILPGVATQLYEFTSGWDPD